MYRKDKRSLLRCGTLIEKLPRRSWIVGKVHAHQSSRHCSLRKDLLNPLWHSRLEAVSEEFPGLHQSTDIISWAALDTTKCSKKHFQGFRDGAPLPPWLPQTCGFPWRWLVSVMLLYWQLLPNFTLLHGFLPKPREKPLASYHNLRW